MSENLVSITPGGDNFYIFFSHATYHIFDALDVTSPLVYQYENGQ